MVWASNVRVSEDIMFIFLILLNPAMHAFTEGSEYSMKKIKRRLFFLSIGCLLSGLIFAVVIADEDDRKHGKDGFGPVDNMTYKEQCGACHLAYQPALLPSGSWCKILSSLENHNGADVAIEEGAIKIIRQYLEDNAAEHSSAKRAAKIMRSLDGQTPKRITDISYIRRKHHEIPAEVFKLESVGSFSNCNACHSTAEEGIYEEDNVSIPR